MTVHEERFPSMGTTARLLVDADEATAARALRDARRRLDDHEATLSRFRPDSELCALNRDPREAVGASPGLCQAVRAALWAARRTGGLVDPTLLAALEEAGYGASRAGAPRRALAPLLALAPPRRRARPAASGGWRAIRVHDGVIHRPAALRLDLGGTAKGLAADLLAAICVAAARRHRPGRRRARHRQRRRRTSRRHRRRAPAHGAAAATVPLGAGRDRHLGDLPAGVERR